MVFACVQLISIEMSPPQVKVLNSEDLKVLQKLYENHIPFASHVNSLLSIYFKWKSSHPERKYLTFFGLGNDWKNTGTFVMKFKNFDIFVYTLDDTCENLYNLLRETQILKIEPQGFPRNLYGTRNVHLPAVYKSLQELNVNVKIEWENKTYWLPKEKALEFTIDCPDEVYIGKLNKSHVDLICELWPHAHAGSKEYLSIYVEMNHAYGLFLKENDELVSWIIQNFWGTLIVLETVSRHKRKGYAALITKKMCLEIAKDGINPLCGIVHGNPISERFFQKLGFEHTDMCTFMHL